MQVRDGMSTVTLTVGTGHSLRAAAAAMTERKVGAAVVMDPDMAGPAIITERDILFSVGSGEDPDVELVADHLTGNLVYGHPDWSLDEAAAAMVRGSFRHLVVVEHGDIRGIISVRDIVRCWTTGGTVAELPSDSALTTH